MTQCSRKSWRSADDVEHSGRAIESVNGFDVIECESCGFRHVLPIPTPEELDEVYSHEYYSQEKPFYIEHYLEDKEWWDNVYTARLSYIESQLGKSDGRLLDIGSGPGLFLNNANGRGWNVVGVEPSSQAAEYSRDQLGLDVRECFLNEESAASLGRFDVVNMGEVLEHLPDPKGMLELVHGLLEDEGVCCLIVPNDFNQLQMVLKDHCGFDPWWVAPPHHLNYFNRDSLEALVTETGFDVVHTETTFPIDMFLMMGQNYIGNDEVGRACHQLRKTFETNLYESGNHEFIRDLYSSLSKLGVGRELVLYARKRS